ncbi:thiamine pyrophosphate-binding protein [Pigmentiphaga soli]|uniref:Thiamine pyrophosphate-binding protein n=1 Tax=Pigmentiphaga soli TaxID=1007095 RepID=A0ABP8GFL5_9BURK
MSVPTPARSGGRLLVDALIGRGCDLAFGVPGESYLAVLDALYDTQDKLRFITCRHEGGAAFMAEAYAKLTGRPGICFVTRGPGATNASIGVHTARQDSTPLILFVGQVGRDFADREAFQEIDFRRMFGQMAKWIASIDRAERVPEYVNKAFQIAQSGRPGPVVLALPEDMLASEAAVPDVPPQPLARPAPREEDAQRLQGLLAQSARPLLLLGGSGWTPAARADAARFADAFGLPVATGFRRQDLFDNRHDAYAGYVGLGMDPKLAQRVREADLLIVAGSRLGEMVTLGYELFGGSTARRALVHAHADPQELGTLFDTTLAINAGMPELARMLARLPARPGPWRQWTQSARQDYLASLEPPPAPEVPLQVDMAAIVHWLNLRLRGEVVVTNGAGNYAGWAHRYFQHGPQRRQLGPTSGAMGYSVPSAVAAKLAHPDRVVVSFAGDGCYMMNGQELATAVQYDAPIIVIVVNNGVYGTIRMHQRREYPGRPSGTALRNPDFARLAEAYGGHGETVLRTADFAPAFERALASGKPAVIDVRTEPRAITTRLIEAQN